MRILLTLRSYRLREDAVKRAAIAAFGDRFDEYTGKNTDVRIGCTPEQFAEFLVARGAFGGTNSWLDLDVTLSEAVRHTPSVVYVDAGQ